MRKGGRRSGAGRRSTGRTKSVRLYLSPEGEKILDASAELRKVPKGQVVDELLKQYGEERMNKVGQSCKQLKLNKTEQGFVLFCHPTDTDVGSLSYWGKAYFYEPYEGLSPRIIWQIPSVEVDDYHPPALRGEVSKITYFMQWFGEVVIDFQGKNLEEATNLLHKIIGLVSSPASHR
jgi:hypothetical protein